MEVQDVALDGKRFGAERWAVADIRHCFEAFVAHAQPRNVDAVGGHQLVVARKVDGGNSVLVAVTAAPTRIAKNTERSPQQRACPADIALRNQLAYFAAGNVMPAQQLLRKNLGLKPKLPAEVGEGVDVAAGLMSEVEVVTFMHLTRM